MEWKEYIYVGNLMQLKGKKTKKKKVRLLEFVSKNLGCRWSWAWSCPILMQYLHDEKQKGMVNLFW